MDTWTCQALELRESNGAVQTASSEDEVERDGSLVGDDPEVSPWSEVRTSWRNFDRAEDYRQYCKR
jgi:hypothetical protein